MMSSKKHRRKHAMIYKSLSGTIQASAIDMPSQDGQPIQACMIHQGEEAECNAGL